MIPYIKILLKSKDIIVLMSKYIIVVAIIMAIIFALAFFTSCQCAPTRDSYKSEECYMAEVALFRLLKNQDKSSAMPIINTCNEKLKLNQKVFIMEYCKKNCPKKLTESECRMWLNQK